MLTEVVSSLHRGIAEFKQQRQLAEAEKRQVEAVSREMRGDCEALLERHGIRTRLDRKAIVFSYAVDLLRGPGRPRYILSDHTDLTVTLPDGRRVTITADTVGSFQRTDEIRVREEGRNRQIATNPFTGQRVEVDDCLVLRRNGRNTIRIGVGSTATADLAGLGLAARDTSLEDAQYYTQALSNIKQQYPLK